MPSLKQTEAGKSKEKPCQLMAETELLTQSWNTWFDGNGVTTDFMIAREQPADQVRQSVPTPSGDTIPD